jgi:RND family efflux transporter MFP subunit
MALAATACGGHAPDEDETKPAEVPTIAAETARVERRTLVDDLLVRGIVATVPNEDVKVSALVAGRVNALPVAEGDTVRRGQVIAELDPQPLQDQRRQAAAAVDQAKAQVENARLNLQRNQQLFDRGIAAGKEVEDARAQLAQAEASLEQGTAALNIADRNIERASVRAPISGQVVKRMVSVGEQVDGTAAQPIVEIANLDRVELAANVPAEYLPRIKVRQTATIASDAAGAETFSGTVIAIAPAVDATTNAALVRLRIANPGHALKVGMYAEARVALAEHANALVVPPAALVRDQRGTAVYRAAADTAERTEVKVGLEKADAIEILDGLKDGDTVLTSSVYGLGQKAKLAAEGRDGRAGQDGREGREGRGEPDARGGRDRR